MKIVKKNYKIIIAFILGITISSIGVYAVNSISADNINYTNSKLSSTNVQDAIDELYDKADIRKAGRFVAAYTYKETGENKCITGEEPKCERTTCYKNENEKCPAGTIIKYKVNDTDIVNFHVMLDEGKTITMQSQKNIIYNTAWYIDSINNKNGPLTVLEALEKATRGWSNVNDQTYTLGTENFSGKGSVTGCDESNLNCETNAYTLESRTAKARMITVQEAMAFNCSREGRSCQKWLNNYLDRSTEYGGTVDDLGNGRNHGYLTMNAASNSSYRAYRINCNGFIASSDTNLQDFGARAVVKVSK